MKTQEDAKQFCQDAKEAGVSLAAVAGAVKNLQGGIPMSEDELEACEFMGKHDFCNDGQPGLYFGAILDHKDTINDLLR